MNQVTQPLRDEHADLLPKVEAVRAAADKVGGVKPATLLPAIDVALVFLRRELIPHAKAEEAVLYPAVDRLLGAPNATFVMSLDHEEVVRLTDMLGDLRDRVATGTLTHQDEDELRLVLYGLFVLVKLHFHKEEAGYLPLLDAKLNEHQARELFRAMEDAAGKVKAAL